MHGQEGKARLEALTEETRYTTSGLSLEVSGSFSLEPSRGEDTCGEREKGTNQRGEDESACMSDL